MSYFNQVTSLFDPSNLSAFGTLEVADPTPIMQGDFVYGLNSQMWNSPVTNGATANVTTSNGMLQVIGSTATSGYAYVTSRKIVRYRAGQGNIVRFTPVFTTGVANTIQAMGVGQITANALYDGYFFGYSGTSFGILHYNRGNLSFYSQASWNGDKVNGSAGTSFTYNPNYGTPLMIKYPYLGFGDIEFFMQVPTTGRWTLVHTIQYANSSATTQISNPSMHFLGFVSNSATATSMTLGCGSFSVLLSGQRNLTGNPKWAMDASKNGITTESLLLSIKNCTTYNGLSNRGMIRLNSVSFASNNNSVSVLMFKLGATITGSPSYTPINGVASDAGVAATLTSANSIASYDTAGTITAGSGTYIFNISIGQTGSSVIDLTPFDIYIAPTEILSLSAKSSASSLLGVSLNWSEDV